MVHAYTFRFPQEVETDPSVLTYGRFRVRFAYGRSGDSRKDGDPGQDYLALRIDRERLAFVLCDGVSQSFYGDLAAHILGDLLLDWLWAQEDSLLKESFQHELVEKLNSWTAEGREAVERFRLPENIAPMVRGVLEKKRAIGSETMFVAGLLTLPGRDNPDGQLCLAWLGDSRLQLHRADLDLTSRLEADFSSEYRWSTHAGVKSGQPGVYLQPPGAAERVLAFSDGFEPVEHLLVEADEADLAAYIQDLQTSPTSDDISFLDVMLLPEAGREQVPLIAPLSPKVCEGGPNGISTGPSTLYWNDVAAADGFDLALELTDGNIRILQATDAVYPFADIEGAVRVRVRARRDVETGPWSGWTELKPAAAEVREAVITAAVTTAPDPAVVEMLTPVKESAAAADKTPDGKPARSVWLPWVPAVAVIALALIFGGKLLRGGENAPVETIPAEESVAVEVVEPTTAAEEADSAEEAAEPLSAEEMVEEQPIVEPLWLVYPENLSKPPQGGLVRVGKGLPVDARFNTRGDRVFLAASTGLYSLETASLQEFAFISMSAAPAILAVSPAGVELAAGTVDGRVIVYDQADLTLLSEADLASQPVKALAYSLDGVLAAGLADGSVLLRSEGETWREVAAPGSSAVVSLAFSADGSQLVGGFAGGGLVQYSLAGDEVIPLRYFLEHDQLLPRADGWISRISNGSVMAWNARGEITDRYTGNFSRIASLPGGDLLLADSAQDELIKLTAEGSVRSVLEKADNVSALDGTSDGRVLWLTRSGELNVSDGQGGTASRTVVPAALQTAWIDAAAGRLYWTDPQGGVLGRSLEDGSLLEDLRSVRSRLSSLSGFDSLLVSGFSDGGALLLEPEADTLEVLLAYPGEVTTVALAEDSSYAAAGTVEGAVNIWDLTLRDWRVTVFSAHSPVTALAVDPANHELLWVANANGRLAGWDSGQGGLVRELVSAGPEISALVLKRDGSGLAYTEVGGDVVLMDLAGVMDPIHLTMDSEAVSLAFSPDGSELAVGTVEGTVSLWSAGGTLLDTFIGHTAAVVSFDFTEEGSVLWSASLDGTAIAWDVSGE